MASGNNVRVKYIWGRSDKTAEEIH